MLPSVNASAAEELMRTPSLSFPKENVKKPRQFISTSWSQSRSGFSSCIKPRNLNCVSWPTPTSFVTSASHTSAAPLGWPLTSVASASAFTSKNCSWVAASASQTPRARSTRFTAIHSGLVRTALLRTNVWWSPESVQIHPWRPCATTASIWWSVGRESCRPFGSERRRTRNAVPAAKLSLYVLPPS